MTNHKENYTPPQAGEHVAARSEQEQYYLDLVRTCHALGEWYPGATQEQCDGLADNPVRKPTSEHPALSLDKYHQERQPDAPLNVKGRKKLRSMQRSYDHSTSKYASYVLSELAYGSELDIEAGWRRLIADIVK